MNLKRSFLSHIKNEPNENELERLNKEINDLRNVIQMLKDTRPDSTGKEYELKKQIYFLQVTYFLNNAIFYIANNNYLLTRRN